MAPEGAFAAAFIDQITMRNSSVAANIRVPTDKIGKRKKVSAASSRCFDHTAGTKSPHYSIAFGANRTSLKFLVVAMTNHAAAWEDFLDDNPGSLRC